MIIHIEYDREENKIELILDSQSNVIRTLNIESWNLWRPWHFIEKMQNTILPSFEVSVESKSTCFVVPSSSNFQMDLQLAKNLIVAIVGYAIMYSIY